MKFILKYFFLVPLLIGFSQTIDSYWVGENFEKISEKISIKVDGNSAKVVETFELKNLSLENNSAAWPTAGLGQRFPTVDRSEQALHHRTR